MEEPFMKNAPLQSLQVKKQIQIIIAVVMVMLLLIGTCLYYQSGAPFFIGRVSSPDGSHQLLVYDGNLLNPFGHENVVTFKSCNRTGNFSTGIYPGKYQGIYWSSDNKFILCTKDGYSNFEVIDFDRGSGRSVGMVIDPAFVNACKNTPGCGFQLDSSVKGNYQFQRWSQDGNYLLFYFDVIDTNGLQRKGYFWYSYLTDTISGVQPM